MHAVYDVLGAVMKLSGRYGSVAVYVCVCVVTFHFPKIFAAAPEETPSHVCESGKTRSDVLRSFKIERVEPASLVATRISRHNAKHDALQDAGLNAESYSRSSGFFAVR